MSEYAFNLLRFRDTARLEEFEALSRGLDRPTLIAQDVVQGFDAYTVTRCGRGAPPVDIGELMRVRSWEEWVELRDTSRALKPVSSRFVELVDPETVRTIFCRKISAR